MLDCLTHIGDHRLHGDFAFTTLSFLLPEAVARLILIVRALTLEHGLDFESGHGPSAVMAGLELEIRWRTLQVAEKQFVNALAEVELLNVGLLTGRWQLEADRVLGPIRVDLFARTLSLAEYLRVLSWLL